jgi:hypothetical protein
MFDLLGVAEVCETLTLTRGALHHRRHLGDFPDPIAEVAATPLWTREQIHAYARSRAARFEERPGIEALAAETDDLTIDQAAATIGVDVARLEAVAREHPTLPATWNRSSGRILSIPRSGLGLWASACAVDLVEVRA